MTVSRLFLSPFENFFFSTHFSQLHLLQLQSLFSFFSLLFTSFPASFYSHFFFTLSSPSCSYFFLPILSTSFTSSTSSLVASHFLHSFTYFYCFFLRFSSISLIFFCYSSLFFFLYRCLSCSDIRHFGLRPLSSIRSFHL